MRPVLISVLLFDGKRNSFRRNIEYSEALLSATFRIKAVKKKPRKVAGQYLSSILSWQVLLVHFHQAINAGEGLRLRVDGYTIIRFADDDQGL